MNGTPDRLFAALAGRYRIERELGAGGMATVYLAHDERHDRNVALKVLKPELAAVIGADRFLHEIKTTANLQHPNILPLHDSGTVEGTVWYVMPLVEGESLRDRLKHETQLPIDDAVGIAREVASALDYAHRHGVIHRDIKPENILLHDGRAVVADFGIALAMSRTEGGTRLTETGMSLGTPHYMSPEQALGEKTVDARTDVYALGAVLYEMLVGEPPFTGPSAQAIIAKVMNAPAAPIAPLRPTVPAAVEAAVMRALAKLPADRFKSAADFGTALQAGAGGAVTLPSATGARVLPTPASTGILRFVPWVVAAGAVAVAVSVAMRGRAGGDARVTAAVIPLEIRTPTDAPLNEIGVPLDISRDGSFIVYVGPDPEQKGATALWRRPLDRLESTPIGGTRGAQRPRISHDGKQVHFLVRAPRGGANIGKVVPVEGGIAQDPGPMFSGENAHQLADGRVLLIGRDKLFRLAPGDSLPPPGQLMRARTLFDTTPDGRLVAVAVASLQIRDSIKIGPVDGTRTFLALGMSPRFIDNRTMAFRAPDGSLMVGRLDGKRLRLVAPPIAMVPGVAAAGTEHAIYAIADDGTLVYQPGGSAGAARMTWVRQDGTESRAGGGELRDYGGVALAPDGRRAVATVGALVGTGDLWMEELVSGARNPLTTDGRSTRASWSFDGKWLAFIHPDSEAIALRIGTGGAVYALELARGEARPERVAELKRPRGFVGIAEFQWSPDRRAAVLRMTVAGQQRDVLVRRPGDSTFVPFAADSGVQERGPRFSPDGKWLLYVSDRSGRDEVYVDAFPAGGARMQVSLESGREALWSRDGSRILYRSIDGWMNAATLARGASVTVTKRERLFDAGAYIANQYLVMYDVAPDGRFLMLKREAQAPRTDVVIIRGWAQQVIARLKNGAQ